MKRVLLVTALGALALLLAAPQAVAAPLRPGLRLAGVNFVTVCQFSHRAQDDPIVFPGQPGAAHSHDFFANTSTDAFSTLESLLAADTTCNRPGDTAAYWTPTLSVNGEPVRPSGVTVYYRARTLPLGAIQPFPPGLKMIAGDAGATSPQPRRITNWSCGPEAVPPSSEPPTCSGPNLRLHVRFPDCWNGDDLDSANHRSHMAYSVRGRCPESYPVPVPAVAMIFRYPITGGDGVELSSGGVYSAHADFFNAWHQPTLNALVRGCLNAGRHCGRRGPGMLVSLRLALHRAVLL